LGAELIGSANETSVFILPGLGNSGPEHWQSYWEKNNPSFKRIQQTEWDAPDCCDWVAVLDQAIKASQLAVVLVGHSSSCALINHWAMYAKNSPQLKKVNGALLVAPSDVEADSYPPGTKNFHPMPLHPLPFPSIVVASMNDIYVSLARVQFFAKSWGSQLVNIGAAGHINSASAMGDWPEGMQLLQTLSDREKQP
jgi:uncharacterized protein